MLIIKELIGNNYTADYLMNTYNYIAFGRIQNKLIAIVSNYETPYIHTVTVQEDIKRPLYKVDMDLRLGKGYKPTQKQNKTYKFQYIENPYNYKGYEVYSIVRM